MSSYEREKAEPHAGGTCHYAPLRLSSEKAELLEEKIGVDPQ